MFSHLSQNNENYFSHMKSALKISLIMLTGSIQALIHAIYPDVFTNSASNKCRMIVKIVDDKTTS